jgi:hypothetical protein
MLPSGSILLEGKWYPDTLSGFLFRLSGAEWVLIAILRTLVL